MVWWKEHRVLVSSDKTEVSCHFQPSLNLIFFIWKTTMIHIFSPSDCVGGKVKLGEKEKNSVEMWRGWIIQASQATAKQREPAEWATIADVVFVSYTLRIADKFIRIRPIIQKKNRKWKQISTWEGELQRVHNLLKRCSVSRAAKWIKVQYNILPTHGYKFKTKNKHRWWGGGKQVQPYAAGRNTDWERLRWSAA